MIRYSKLQAWFCLFIMLFITLLQSFSVFGDVMTPSNAFVVNPDYLIGSASNADPYGIATMELTDEDYGIAPASSAGSVVNTVDYSGIYAWVNLRYKSDNAFAYTKMVELDENGHFFTSFDDNLYCYRVMFSLTGKNIPPAGVYSFSMDFASDFTVNYDYVMLQTRKSVSNADEQFTQDLISFNAVTGGDVYVPPVIVGLSSLSYFEPMFFLHNVYGSIGGYASFNFSRSSGSPTISTAGYGNISSDYQSDVSSSLSDISSSIGDMSSSMDSASESLEYISTSQNLIIQGIDNVIMHISDQLYAFWDQLYNLIHEPTYARLGDILDAIRNLDLEITVEMTEVTNAVNKMNQDMQNKLQQTTDKITGGYDSSVLESENQQIQSAVDEYDQSEQAILDSVEGNIEDFSYPSFDDLPLGTLGALGFFGGLLQSIFEGMGAFNMIITFSLTLVFVLILIGYHRIRN